MTATVEVGSAPIPLKCRDHDAAGVPRNDCTEPGSQLKCQLCPASPNYWLREEVAEWPST